ncbi:CIR protein PIR protein [Plasmodium vinckei vinckei]|uniref:CIR protein PIR protein n=1 Tax=Plasmodium vinckei vinckei TaxID=54757 RepID=A0A449BRV7_PLAVN|nr:CIR protein PIR protein [Plasmodium vinckei vinckei]VEV56200.1 CIR protein PIR protein [Plasmodium vinckei vinckei]
MDTKKMCKLFHEADSYFNGKDVNTQKINNEVTIKGYCNNGGCKTNEDGINALAAYIYMKFKGLIIIKTQHNNYDEYLLMWISDKLFKMYHESKGENKKKGFVYPITLNQAYEEYLDKYKQRWDFWVLLDMQQGLKGANLKYMSEFYKLLNNICKTIVDYKNKGVKSSQLSKYSKNCLNQYRILYMNIPKCKSYLDLLNKLKGIYDDFRSRSIKNTDSKNDLKTKLIKLTLGNGEEMKAVKGFKRYDFSNEQCKLPKKKKKIVSPPLQSSSKKEPPPLHDTKTKEPKLQLSPESAPQSSESQQTPTPLPTTPQVQKHDSPSTSPSPEKESSQLKLPNSPQSQEPKSDTSPKDQSIEQKDSGGDTENQKSPQNDLNKHDQTPVTNKGGSDDGEGVKDSEPEGSGSGSGDQGSNNGGSEDLNGGTSDTDKGPLNTGGGGNGELTGTNTEKGDSEDGLVDKVNEAGDIDNGKDVSKGGEGNVSGGDQKSPDGSGDSDSVSGGGAGGTNSVPGDQISNGSQGDENTSQQGTSGGSDHGTGNQGSSSHQGGDTGGDKRNQDGSDGTGGGVPTPNEPSSPLPKDLPQSPPGTPHTSLPSQNPKEQTNPVQSSQDPSGNKNSDKTDQQEAQKPVSNPVTKQENPGTELKGNGITGIDDGYVLKKYKKIVISIIVILIPITLTILYKYLSFGRRKELKKKTNMKKVINSIGGKKQIQIIIKSSSRKKQTKKSINSVHRKKPSLLNIYKIMQADPVPFINLFFLLIFFVYKRKSDFLEL